MLHRDNRINPAYIISVVLVTAMFSVSRAFRLDVLPKRPSLQRFGLLDRGGKQSHAYTFRGLSAAKEDVVNTDMGVYSQESASKNTKPGKQYDFTHELLPEETMYIFDGTAMLFASHFSSAAALKQLNATSDDNKSTAPVKAVLGEHLNAKIVANMSDEQIRDMLAAFDNMDGIKPSSLSSVNKETSSSTSEGGEGGVNNTITAECRAALQLRCDPLVTLLWQFARLVRDIKPKYVAVAFDAGRHTFRKDLYPAYKLQRTETPPVLVPLLPLTVRVLEAVGCVCVAEVGYEGDDLMASLGRWAKGRGLNVVHYSMDKDMLQLVEPGVHVMLPRGREMVDAQHVQTKFGIAHPAQMRDLQALMGDTADNIPGVKGVGAKAAAALLQQFHTVPELFSHLGLVGLPPVPAELAEVTPSSPSLKAHVQSVLGEEKMERAVALLLPCFDGSRAKATSTLCKLYRCGYDAICLYRELVTLKEDINMEEIVLRDASTSDKLDRLRGPLGKRTTARASLAVLEATADLPQTHASSAQVHGIVQAMEEVLLDPPSTINSVADTPVEVDVSRNGNGGAKLTTAHFRYRGERGAQVGLTSNTPVSSSRKKKSTVTAAGVAAPDVELRTSEEVEALLAEISPALMAPLQLLRQQYHKLPKD